MGLDVVGKPGVELSDLVDVDAEPVGSSLQVLNPFLVSSQVKELLGLLVHLLTKTVFADVC